VASGIGAALARCLADQGHKLIGFDLREPQVTVDQFISVDLGDVASIRQAAAQVTTKLDGLCNNAGVPPRDGSEEVILQVNFLGQRAFTQQMLPHLVPGGSIVNMASRAGHGWRDNLEQVKRLAAVQDVAELRSFVQAEGLDPTRAYNLSKEAMILWTLSEAEPMLARGLRINSLSPGGIETAILDDFRRVFGDAMARNVARAGRPGLPEEVAEVAAFVLSPRASWLKGIDIPIDGGMGAFNATDQLGLAALRLPMEV